MHIWKYCWECKHDTPQNRLNLRIHPRVIEGFSKNTSDHQSIPLYTYSVDAYQFTECQKCNSPSLHLDSFHVKDINENTSKIWDLIKSDLEKLGKCESYHVCSTSFPQFNKSLLHEKKWSFNLPQDDMLLFFEVISAYEKGLFILALSGIRTLIDRYLVKKVGDIGGFEKKLKRMLDDKHINSTQYEILNTIIDGGNASNHRGFRPEQQMVKTFLEVVEEIISLDYKTEKFNAFKEQIPKRTSK